MNEKEFWNSKIKNTLVSTKFPYDFNRDILKIIESDKFDFSNEVSKRIITICNGADAKIHVLLSSFVILLLNKYNNSSDVAILTTVDNCRDDKNNVNDLIPIIGSYQDSSSIKDLLIDVGDNIIDAVANSSFEIRKILKGRKNQNFDCISEVGVILENIHNKNLVIKQSPAILFSFSRVEDSICCELEYNESKYSRETINLIKEYLLNITHNAIYDFDQKISGLKIKNTLQANNYLNDDKQLPSIGYRNVVGQFENAVDANMDLISIKIGDYEMSYLCLNQKANQAARNLLTYGISKNDIIAISLDRSIEFFIGILAILKVGAAFLPIDINTPKNKRKRIFENSKTKFLVTNSKSRLYEDGVSEILLDDQQIYQGDDSNLDLDLSNEVIAYVIYTSGTTGNPKGVRITHKNLLNYTNWAIKTYFGEGHMRFAFFTSISFDLTMTSIFTPLLSGNTVVIFPETEGEIIIDKIFQEEIEIIKVTPSHLKLISERRFENSKLKKIIVGGEQLYSSLAWSIYFNLGSNVQIFNEYGPTEATIGCCVHKYHPNDNERLAVPIGIPIDNTQIYLLDNNLEPTPIGFEGDLYISGECLCKDYKDDAQLNKEKFIYNPLITNSKMYRTGDRGRQLYNGKLEFTGRVDNQLKISGQRIEKEEIEGHIIDFLKKDSSERKIYDYKDLKRCKTCILPENYPDISFNDEGECNYCQDFTSNKLSIQEYFKTQDDFRLIVNSIKNEKNAEYDCLLLYSGGKDSSYVLEQLLKFDLKVLTFTFDNGYLSENVFNNIKTNTKKYKVDNITVTAENINEIFLSSIKSYNSICNGCFKTVNTLATKYAHEHDIRTVITGLSQGQIMSIKLEGLLKSGIHDAKLIEKNLKLFRNEYHSSETLSSKVIGTNITSEVIDGIQFIDYYRYDTVTTNEILDYLGKSKYWVKPKNTGQSSTNCKINDLGIYIHIKNSGYHFYDDQLSWECRLNKISREEALNEIMQFKPSQANMKKLLKDIGYRNGYFDCHVVKNIDDTGNDFLQAFIKTNKKINTVHLNDYLRKELPQALIPNKITVLDEIPLTINGKVDLARVSEKEEERLIVEEEKDQLNDIEKRILKIWANILAKKQNEIGLDDNFYDLGGHSMKVTVLYSKLKKEFNIEFTFSELFKTLTIRKFYNMYKDRFQDIIEEEKKDNIFLLRKGKDTKKNILFMCNVANDYTVYSKLSQRMPEEYNCYVVDAYFEQVVYPQEFIFKDFVSKITTTIIEQNVSKYDFVIGWSIGGIISLELVAQLESKNFPIGMLLLIDPTMKVHPSKKITEGFELNTEKEFILRNIKIDSLKPKINKANSIKDVWDTVIKYFKNREGIENLEDSLTEEFNNILTNYNKIETEELVARINMLRSINQSITSYEASLIEEKLIVYYSDTYKNEDSDFWKFISKKGITEINIIGSDHYSILDSPQILELIS